jgi:uncharacterized membrane protein (UPF0127 family)
MKRPALISALAASVLTCASFTCAAAGAQDCPSPPENDTIDFGATEPLAVETREGGSHAFQVEIADTPLETSRGLMFRPEIAPDFGMLFLFPESSERSFYMRNTCASLDIIFVRANGEIASIVRRATPYSLRSLPSNGPVQAVLELAGGRAAELGVAPGDKVVHPRIGQRLAP